MRFRLALILILLCLTTAPARRDAIDRRIDAMPTEERIGQLLFVGFEGTTVTPELRTMLREWKVGGVALYAPNISSPEQVRTLNGAILATAAGAPPFLALDQEGGTVQRMRSGVPELPTAMAIGATRSPALARRAGRALASDLRGLGFTMNFAPVLDVLSNPANTALGTRAFSDDPAIVASLGSAIVRGQLDGGVLPVAKHFPGQGGTAGDSHFTLPSLDVTRAQLATRELVPFRAAFEAGVPAVLTAHIALPRIAEAPSTPATLSSRILTDLLRKELRFDGLVITDELQMRSVRGDVSVGEAAVRAVLAGADMLLVVWERSDRIEVRTALLQAYASGRLPEARVRASLRRILRTKANLPAHHSFTDSALLDEIATASLTQLIPPPPARATPLAADARIAFIGPDGPLRSRFAKAPWITTPPRVDDAIVKRAAEQLRGHDTIVAAVASANDRELARRLRPLFPDARWIVIGMTTPADARTIPDPTMLVMTYSSSKASQEAAGRWLVRQ